MKILVALAESSRNLYECVYGMDEAIYIVDAPSPDIAFTSLADYLDRHMARDLDSWRETEFTTDPNKGGLDNWLIVPTTEGRLANAEELAPGIFVTDELEDEDY